MFTVLRCVAIIGLIFYFSPAREVGPSLHHPGEDRKPAPVPFAAAMDAQDTVWNRLVGQVKEEAVRTVVNDKSLSDKAVSAGVRLSENAARSLIAPPRPPAAEKPRPAEPDQASRAAQDASVRCIYRCDGTE